MSVTDYGRFLSVPDELKFLLLSILLGAVLGSAFDLFRTLRVSLPHNALWVAVEDFAYCLLFCFSWYVFCVDLLGGALRFYILFGMSGGFLLYYITIGKIAMKIVRALNNLLTRAGKSIIKLLKKRKNP